MEIFLIILAVIFLIIDILIFCPVSVKLVYNGELKLRAGYLFPVFRILPAKPRKQKPEKKKKKKEKKKEKEKPAEEEKKNPIGNLIKKDGLSGLIDLLKAIAKIATEAVKKITDHTVISRMDLKLYIATEDAAKTAVTYGYACSAVFPLISVIENRVRKCDHTELIMPVFTEEKTKAELVMKVRIVPFFVLSAGVKAALKSLRLLAKLR